MALYAAPMSRIRLSASPGVAKHGDSLSYMNDHPGNYLTWAYRPKNAGTGVRTKIKQMGWSNAADSGHGMHGMDTFQLIVDTSACAPLSVAV